MSRGVVYSEVVRPSQPRWETPLLLAATLGLLLFTGLYTLRYGRQEPAEALTDWQISAYTDLQGADQAIHGQLLVAAEEIYWMHFYNNRWPDIGDFQEVYLPPFYRDLGWERNGAVQWSLARVSPEDANAGITIYHGAGGKLADQGAWLLVINHSHAGGEQVSDTTIWYHPDADAELPAQSATQAFVREGWTQVIPYQGRDEVERLRG